MHLLVYLYAGCAPAAFVCVEAVGSVVGNFEKQQVLSPFILSC